MQGLVAVPVEAGMEQRVHRDLQAAAAFRRTAGELWDKPEAWPAAGKCRREGEHMGGCTQVAARVARTGWAVYTGYTQGQPVRWGQDTQGMQAPGKRRAALHNQGRNIRPHAGNV